jgi:hypothetical protein
VVPLIKSAACCAPLECRISRWVWNYLEIVNEMVVYYSRTLPVGRPADQVTSPMLTSLCWTGALIFTNCTTSMSCMSGLRNFVNLTGFGNYKKSYNYAVSQILWPLLLYYSFKFLKSEHVRHPPRRAYETLLQAWESLFIALRSTSASVSNVQPSSHRWSCGYRVLCSYSL